MNLCNKCNTNIHQIIIKLESIIKEYEQKLIQGEQMWNNGEDIDHVQMEYYKDKLSGLNEAIEIVRAENERLSDGMKERMEQ